MIRVSHVSHEKLKRSRMQASARTDSPLPKAATAKFKLWCRGKPQGLQLRHMPLRLVGLSSPKEVKLNYHET